ncbi:NEP1-interacting protein 1-like [Olea europaea var. sylvestris]|uniref:NEP1-interacting protein 1-like n=1 Tax=Olea europaea var. sylvestris TaxID=158386 RepID=UPI000C1D02FC|nr:NEP1-interacting protein 1-like [Olea europaea var. sylvestris]
MKTWFSSSFSRFSAGSLSTMLRKTAVALLACILGLGGVTAGIIVGAIKGQTTETGFLRGAGVGAMAGVIAALQLMELILYGEPFSKLMYYFVNCKPVTHNMANLISSTLQER